MVTITGTVTRCRSCQAPIVWVTHVLTGKTAPLDALAVPDGNCVYYPLDNTYRVIKKGDQILPPEEEARRHTNHFQTCKDAKGWSRR
jgi:hypothetical protein